MTDRDTRMHAFVAGTDWAGAQIALLAGDASNRRYMRVAGPRAVVLMDAPPEKGEDVRPFVAVTQLLRARGLSAPEIIARDEDGGFLLLEDLGDDLYARVAATADETTLYAAAVDLLGDLEGRGTEGLAPYDLSTILREARLLTDWYLTGAGRACDAARIVAFEAAVARALLPHLSTRAVVLRDYHAENLIWLPDRDGVGRVGLLDYQDALAGHPAYDLVSLLEDARRDTTEEMREAMIRRHLARSGADEREFRAAYAAWGAQRNIKILGIFARLWLRDGKSSYLDLMPRVWDHLQRDLAHPDLAELRAWIERQVPAPEADLRETLRAAR
ncbi:aminoglycoside phosphotransferase family protein [Roseobacter sp. HKCCA0434]|uniref:aminoglycoside phosphotransferase family protein n=1 Tax=Roseobacter sp. HKCCA0434 TaxID=3079297 RepID=UPI002905B6DD|nr:phosphotransferase [Roseobacter sp. HKCCA0434]